MFYFFSIGGLHSWLKEANEPFPFFVAICAFVSVANYIAY